ncbi:MAG: hypothetical protein ACFFCW_21335 [Candidatus Hodarchaeota archaeon]
MALLFDTGGVTHSPGPNGLPAGYPARLSAKGAELLFEEMNLEEVIHINQEVER